jgi:hypothetical protein
MTIGSSKGPDITMEQVLREKNDVRLVLTIRKRFETWLTSAEKMKPHATIWKWIFKDGEIIPEAAKKLHTKYYEAWKSLDWVKHIIHIEYEHLLARPHEVLNPIEDKYGVKSNNKSWNLNVGPQIPFPDERRVYYLKGTLWQTG